MPRPSLGPHCYLLILALKMWLSRSIRQTCANLHNSFLHALKSSQAATKATSGHFRISVYLD